MNAVSRDGQMSLDKMLVAVRKADLPKNDREWFPRRLNWFAEFSGTGRQDTIPIERDAVVGFLKYQKERRKLAWQRLQAVRTIEFYRDQVLRQLEPPLEDIRQKLAEIAEGERPAAVSSNQGGFARPDEIGRNRPE